MADDAWDGIGGVPSTASQVATAEVTLCPHRADHGLDGGGTYELADTRSDHLRDQIHFMWISDNNLRRILKAGSSVASNAGCRG